MRPTEKTREWERQRRDRLNEGFSSLLKEIPELATAENASKLKVLQTAASYIRRLRELVAESSSSEERGCRKCNTEGILKQDRAVQVDVPNRPQSLRLGKETSIDDTLSCQGSETAKILQNVENAQSENIRTLRLSRNKQFLTSKRSIRQLREILSENIANQNLKNNEKVDDNQIAEPALAPQPVLVISTSTGSVVIVTSPFAPKPGVGRFIFPKNKIPCSRLPLRKAAPRLAVKRKVTSNETKEAKKRKVTEITKSAEKCNESTPAPEAKSVEKTSVKMTEPVKSTKEIPVSEHNFSITNVLQPQQSKANESTPEENGAQTAPEPEMDAVSANNDVAAVPQSVYTYPSCYYANTKSDTMAYNYQGYYDYNTYNSFSYDSSHFSTYSSTYVEQPTGMVENTGSERVEESIHLQKSDSNLIKKADLKSKEMAESDKNEAFNGVKPQITAQSGRSEQPPRMEEPQITELVNAPPQSVSYQLLGQFQASSEGTSSQDFVKEKENSAGFCKDENKYSKVQSLGRNLNQNPGLPEQRNQVASYATVQTQVEKGQKPTESTQKGKNAASGNATHTFLDSNVSRGSHSQFISHAIGNLIEKTRESTGHEKTEVCNKARGRNEPTGQPSSKNPENKVQQPSFPKQDHLNITTNYSYETHLKDNSCQSASSTGKAGSNSCHTSNSCQSNQIPNISTSSFSHISNSCQSNQIPNTSTSSFSTLSQAWKTDSKDGRNLPYDSKCRKSQRILSVSQLVEQPKVREAQKSEKPEKSQQPVTTASVVASRDRQVPSFSIASTQSIAFSSSHSISTHTSTAQPVTTSFVQQGKLNQQKQTSYNDFDRSNSYKSYSRGYCAYSAEALINQDYGSSEQFRNQQPYTQWSYNQQYFPSSVNTYSKNQGFSDNSQYQQFQFADQSFYSQNHHQFSQDLNIGNHGDSVSDSSSFFQYSAEMGRSGCEKPKNKDNRQADTQHSYYPEHGALTVPLPSFSSILEDVSFATPALDAKTNKLKGAKQEKLNPPTGVSWSHSIPTVSHSSSDETKRNKKEAKQTHNVAQSKKNSTSWNTFGNSYQSSGPSNFNVSNIIPEIRYSNTRHAHELGNFQLNTDYGVNFSADLSSGYMSHQNMHLGHSLPANFKPMDFNFSPVVPPAAPFTVPHASTTNFKTQQITK